MKTTFLILFLILKTININAQWSDDPAVNNPVCTFTGAQQNMQMVSDNAGGVLFTWTDTRNGPSKDIYAQRIDANGNKLWNPAGVAICNAVDEQFTPRIISDGVDGAIITWYDNRNPNNWDIYSQRINGNGVVQWTTDGVPICTATGNQTMQQLTTDTLGGAIIVWQDGRNGGPNADIYTQRVNANGTMRWANNGVPVCTATYSQGSPQLIPDGNGGAIITWDDYRGSDADIYVQKVTPNGIMDWYYNGNSICWAGNHQDTPKIISDGAGGAIVCWRDNRNYNLNVFAQKINNLGVSQWASNGVSVCSAPYLQAFTQMVPDNAGGAYFVWEDRRSYSDIYAQRFNNLGTPQWVVDGVAVCTSAPVQKDPQLCLNNSGNLIITWQDNYTDIFAQGLTATGSDLWATDGVPISVATGNQTNPQIVLSGSSNEMIIAWDDSRNDASDIYTSKLSLNGTLPIETFSEVSKINVYPNPVKTFLTIQNLENHLIDKITIIDLTGKKVLDQKMISNTINVEQLQNGMYLLQLISNGKKAVTKFIKN